MGNIAVLDTETNWEDEVMSLGIVTADSRDLVPRFEKYFVIVPEYLVGGMYSGSITPCRNTGCCFCTRDEMLTALKKLLEEEHVSDIYAYNARFDSSHLPELSDYSWFDIMRVAAYKQFNRAIPENAPCYSTGRLRSGYGVEAILRLLTGDCFCEEHNALQDACDELRIMALLGQPIEIYERARL